MDVITYPRGIKGAHEVVLAPIDDMPSRDTVLNGNFDSLLPIC